MTKATYDHTDAAVAARVMLRPAPVFYDLYAQVARTMQLVAHNPHDTSLLPERIGY